MIRTVLAAAVFALAAISYSAALAGDGLAAKQSANSFDDTVARLEVALAERGITVFNKIDHAAGAAAAGQSLRPTTLIIFGNPAVGSQLMAMSQSIGLDLPLKALVYEDESGTVWVAYNDMRFIARRHGLDPENELVGRVAGGLKMVTAKATETDG
ncbi:MAG: DUF302 domain-containing protein [Parvularculaceae bacterium]